MIQPKRNTNNPFAVGVIIRGNDLGYFDEKSYAEEYLGLGMYLSDVMNVEEEYPYDLFLAELRVERILNGFVS